MYSILSLSLLWFQSTIAHSQLNITEISQLDIPTLHETKCNDVWGYVDEFGNEYALVGAEDGVSVVSLADPSSPEELTWIPGMNSVWRDIKTSGDYAYVTTEALEGLLIIDLSPLPGSTELPTTIYTGPAADPWESAHNLYERDGIIYIFGAGRGAGGVIILDVETDPMNPIEIGQFDDWYCHDGYVRDDTGYFAHIYDGFFSIVDLTDKSTPVFLGSAYTPTTFSHNIWTSEDGDFAFTTDEIAGGYLASYDVSDPTSIVYLDKIQSSPGTNKVPHNAHVKGNYLYTSYYTDGLVVHDISQPNNLIEVANFDTSPLSGSTTEGCWGAYPFLPSGLVLATDRQIGLFVLDVNEQPGAYLSGTVTDLVTGDPLNNVSVMIDGTDIVDFSNVSGSYATGTVDPGLKDVSYFKVLYYPETLPILFDNGELVVQDIALEKIPAFNIEITVLDAATLLPIEGASIRAEHPYVDHEAVTDADGTVNVDLYYQDNYQVYAGLWGYNTSCFSDTMLTDELTELTIYLESGYYDDFTFDFEWSSTGTAARGFWEREVPVGVTGGSGLVQNPYTDSDFDCGNYAFMTGNGTSSSNTEEVNDGEVVLVSPVFDLTEYSNPHINYATWFFNMHGGPANDTMFVYLLNGEDVVQIDKLYNGGLPMSQWNPNSIRIEDYIEPSETMQLLLILSDYLETENVTEGGLDFFSITDFSLLSTTKESEQITSVLVYPNPASDYIKVSPSSAARVELYDLSGRLVLVENSSNEINISTIQTGTYFVVLYDEQRSVIGTSKLVKQ
jgi:choice-of-anchor B domain-containing protein